MYSKAGVSSEGVGVTFGAFLWRVTFGAFLWRVLYEVDGAFPARSRSSAKSRSRDHPDELPRGSVSSGKMTPWRRQTC